MQAIGIGLFFGVIYWLGATQAPWVDTTWINDVLGLTRHDALMLSMFMIVGFWLGQLSQGLDHLGKAHDRLVEKVYGRSEM